MTELRVRQAEGTRHPQDTHRPGAEHHRNVQGGAIRAGVFGISDGLLTNVAVILGVAGAHPAASVVRLTGIASLLGGAFSMAAGEYISMTAQTELLERELEVERRAHRMSPEAEIRELAAIYRNRGLTREESEVLATRIMEDPDVALEVHAREELGVDPGQIGSPTAAAISSFLTFAIGAMIPLVPWFFLTGTSAVATSTALGVVMSFSIGWALGVFTGRSRLRSAIRQFGWAAAAASVTYLLGSLIGHSVG